MMENIPGTHLLVDFSSGGKVSCCQSLLGVRFPITQVKSIRVDMEKWPDGLEWEKERN